MKPVGGGCDGPREFYPGMRGRCPAKVDIKQLKH
jgi:hypothetical protein